MRSRLFFIMAVGIITTLIFISSPWDWARAEMSEPQEANQQNAQQQPAPDAQVDADDTGYDDEDQVDIDRQDEVEMYRPDIDSQTQPVFPGDPNDLEVPERFRGRPGQDMPDRRDARRRPGPEQDEDDDPMESINLNNVEMRHLVQRIADWTGKVVIPSDESMQLRLTIYAPSRVPRSRALQLIYAAMRTKGFVAEETMDIIYIKPISEAALGSVPTVQADQPLASIDDRGAVVQKFFRLRHYSPSRMTNIISPLVNEYGHISADDNSGTLLVIETVENLMRIEGIVRQFDVPETDRKVVEVFEVVHADAAEVVQLLRLILSDGNDAPARGRAARGVQQQNQVSVPANAVIVDETEIPTVLIPDSKRRWIIASASNKVMDTVEQWIDRLDTPDDEVTAESQTIQLRYVQADEVATQLTQALSTLPGTDIRANVMIQPLTQSQQILVFGRPQIRQTVRQLIAEIDVPSGQFETRVFRLQHADPEQVQQNIEALYDQDAAMGNILFGRGFRGQQTTAATDVVKVVAFPTMQQVTVVASPENLEAIAKQIEQWDIPINVDEVRPRIIELQNVDPVRMADLLSNLFSEQTTQAATPWWFAGQQQTDQRRIVGPLYGQLTFRAVPDSKKIVVISKIPEAYKVVEEMILELDRREMAEVPEIVVLKYADPEDLSERLNAIFNEPGTVATIRLGERGLSDYSMAQQQQQQQQQQDLSPGEYRPWWTTAQRATDQMPISNVIGRIRFIPDRRSKAIMVLAPREFIDRVVETIRQLDVPGKQVRVQAVIVEVNHRQLTSLGVQLASDRQAFGDLTENAVSAVSRLTMLEERGSLRFESSAEVNAVIDFLLRHTDARILNQQTLWTKDNEEADFFKGRTVAFITSAQTSAEMTAVRQEFEFERVGMSLRIRPNITPERNVDMTINMILSQLTPELINTQPVRTEMETETTMIVRNGETVMLGGMLFQNDSVIQRKIPLLGDLPLVGGLFRHNDIDLTNDEMLVFITPHVIEEDFEQMLRETREKLEEPLRRLEDIRQKMQENLKDVIPEVS